MRTVDELRDRVRELELKVEDLEGMLGELPPEGKCAMLLVHHVDGEYVWACEPYDFASYLVVDVDADTLTGKALGDPFGRAGFADRLTIADQLRVAAAELDGSEIVRCRDCINFSTDDIGDYCTLLDFEDVERMADGFCAWGERKVSA